MTRWLTALLLLAASPALGGVACVIDTPAGTLTCDAVTIRDANAYNLTNVTGLRANNDADITIPAANATMFEIVDTDKTGVYAWTLRHSGRADWMLGTAGGATGNTLSIRNGRMMIFDATIATPDTTTVKAGPMMIWTNPSSTAAGETSGLYINVSSNWVATPAANHVVPLTVRVSNDGQLNADLWGANFVVGNGTNADPTGKTIFLHGIETELMNGCANAAECETDPFGNATGKIRSNGYEAIGHSGSGGRNAASLMVWANDATGDKWWSRGVALSHVADTGIDFRKLAGDAIEPFGVAMFDASTLQSFSPILLKARSDGPVNYWVRNYSNFGAGITVSSGGGTAQNAALSLADGTAIKWSLLKSNGNAFAIWEGDPFFSGNSRIFMDANATTFYGSTIFANEGDKSGVKPTLTGCGTGVTAVTQGSDEVGYLTVGASVGTCALAFARGFVARPVCLCVNETSNQLCRTTSLSGTGFTFAGTLSTNDVLSYHCFQGSAS